MKFNNPISRCALLLLAGIATSRADILIDLKNGVITDTKITPAQSTTTYTSTYVTVSLQKTTTCAATPYEALVSLNFKPTTPANTLEIKKVAIDVQFDSPTATEPLLPRGWVAHIGDDLTNDGYGGGSSIDGGTAEAHITNQQLLVYTTALEPGIVEKLLTQDLQLAAGSITFTVANQFLSWGNPYNELDSTNSKKLFQIPNKNNDYKIYASFNRVINGRADRKGCGARQVVISIR